MADKIVNGVNVSELYEAIEGIKKNKDAAKFKFRAMNRWIQGGHSQVTLKDFEGGGESIQHEEPYIMELDEPPALLGEDKGPNPVEYILVALSGCLTTALVFSAASKGIKLKKIESVLEGELDIRGFLGISDDVPRGYQQIQVTFDIEADAPKEALEELIEDAKNHSPVFDTVTRPIPVEVKLKQ